MCFILPLHKMNVPPTPAPWTGQSPPETASSHQWSSSVHQFKPKTPFFSLIESGTFILQLHGLQLPFFKLLKSRLLLSQTFLVRFYLFFLGFDLHREGNLLVFLHEARTYLASTSSYSTRSDSSLAFLPLFEKKGTVVHCGACTRAVSPSWHSCC